MWILIFTVWALGADGNYQAQETRNEFPTVEECKQSGDTLTAAATEKHFPAVYFCFKKGEKVE